MIYDFTVYGDVKAQGRARAYNDKVGNIRFYDPGKSKDWKRNVLLQALLKYPKPKMIMGPVVMWAMFYLHRPKSRKKDEYHQTTPDLDNLTKAIKDALSKTFYGDDKQIIGIHAQKTYVVAVGDPPSVRVTIQEVGE